MQSPSTALFIRPSNMRISTILQTLSITSHFARKTGGAVNFTHAPREADAQRLLNFTGLSVDDPAKVRSLTGQPSHRIPISERVALNSGSLLYELPEHKRGAGLAEIASIVGIRMADTFKSPLNEGLVEEKSSDIEEKSLIMEVKVERRQTASRYRPGSESNLDPRTSERLVRSLNEFGGFSGSLKVKAS